MRVARILAWSAAVLIAPCAAAAEPTIHDLAKAAVERKEVQKTDMLGFSIIHSSYRDAPQNGAILVGFDLALRRHDDQSEIVAVRPVYLTPRGEVVGNAAGSFSSTRDHKISQTVRVSAKPGYAVGRVTMVAGLSLHAMSVTFMRIKGQRLDKTDSYRSPMFGSRGGSENGRTITSNYGPVVGLFGNVNGPRVIALGLLFVEPPEVEDDEPAPQHAFVPPTPAVTPAPIAAESPAPTETTEEGGTSWVPFVVGGTVVVIVGIIGLGLMLIVNRVSSSPTPPPARKPSAPKPPGPPKPAAPGDDDIPMVYPVDESEPEATPSAAKKSAPEATSADAKESEPEATSAAAKASEPESDSPAVNESELPVAAPARSAPPHAVAATPRAPSRPPVPKSQVPKPPASAPKGQLGMVDYQGEAIAPSDKQASYGSIIFGGIMLAAALAIANYPLQSARDRILVPIVVGGIGAVLFGGGLFAVRYFRKRITVFENGLCCEQGSKQQTLYWADVEAVRDFSVRLFVNGMFQHTTRTIKVRASRGKEIEFSGDAEGIGGLADAVLHRAYDYITPRVLEQLNKGQTVSLGPLSVSAAGVETRLARVEWSRIGNVQLDNGHVIIYEGGSASSWVRVPLGDIDNVQLLFALMDHFASRRP